MAATMFSFLDDASLYGQGSSPQSPLPRTPPVASANLRPAPLEGRGALVARQSPEGMAAAGPPLCVDERGLNVAMDTLQARIASAEKRTVLMEQRVLSALDDCQRRQPPVSTGCSWRIFIFAMLACLGLLMYSARRGTDVHGPPSIMLPSSLPSSQLLMGASLAGVAPQSFIGGC